MKKYIIALCGFSLLGCSTLKYDIKRNKDLREKQVDYFYKKNGNVFFLSSTYANFSTVWSYNKNNIEVYKLVKGKIYIKLSYENVGISNHQIPDEKEFINQTKGCFELDGDGFGFKIKANEIVYNEDYPININCFKTRNYKSEFLNKIIGDVEKYKMWEIEFVNAK